METHVTITDLGTSDFVWQDFHYLAKESSRNAKIEMLKRIKSQGNSLADYVLKMIFDPTIIFGVVLKPEEYERFYGNPYNKTFDTSVAHFLTLLSQGIYTRREAVAEFGRLASKMSECSIRLLVSIINKDLAAGINASTINKVYKGLIPTFPYMRCSLPSQSDLVCMEWGYGVYAQEKADGMFVNINNSLSGIHILSRQGTEIPIDKFPVEAMQLHNVLPVGYQIHGEMLIQNPSGEVAPREIGNGMINSICKGGNVPQGWKIRFHVWDCIPLRYVASKGRYTEPYRSRFEMLSEMISKSKMRLAESGQVISCVHTIETKICYSLAEAQAFFKKMLSQGKEGAVLKNPTAIWRDGTSKEQIKLKLECDCDLEIAGFDEGEGKFRGNLGSLICKSSDGLLVTNVSGFSDKVRKQIWSSREDYLGRIVTVRFNDVMQKTGQPASLFLPRFVEVRSDKIEADTLNRVLESQQQAIALV